MEIPKVGKPAVFIARAARAIDFLYISAVSRCIILYKMY